MRYNGEAAVHSRAEFARRQKAWGKVSITNHCLIPFTAHCALIIGIAPSQFPNKSTSFIIWHIARLTCPQRKNGSLFRLKPTDPTITTFHERGTAFGKSSVKAWVPKYSCIGFRPLTLLQGRPWARNRSWQGFRGQYTRNQAQYDFWIQCYVEENPWLLNEIAERLVEDFADEPGAFEDELAQEEHGRIISRAPNGSPATRNQWPPARVADRTAGTQSRRSPSHPAQAQPNGSQ